MKRRDNLPPGEDIGGGAMGRHDTRDDTFGDPKATRGAMGRGFRRVPDHEVRALDQFERETYNPETNRMEDRYKGGFLPRDGSDAYDVNK